MSSHHSASVKPTDGRTVIVVGAGVCGLATALTLGAQGWRVQVLERRRDPCSGEGLNTANAGKRLLAQANRKLRNGGDAADLLESSRVLYAQQWGARNRSIVLDAHAIPFLEHLGVDTSAFPAFESLDISWGQDQPSLSLSYAARDCRSGQRALDAERLVLQRDWVAQPSIAQLESALRTATTRNPLIELDFEAAVISRSNVNDGVAVQFEKSGRRVLCGALLVLADGGGGQSLSRRIGVARIPYTREVLDVAVFEAEPDDHLRGRRLSEVFGAGGMTSNGWAGFVCNGNIVTVDTRRRPGTSSLSSYAYSRCEGVMTDLVEPPTEAEYAIDRAERFVDGPRTILAGDAAARGTPLFGLGAQYALLWAQMVGELLGEVNTGSSAPDVAAYADEAERIISHRINFEVSCLQVIDQAISGERPLASIATSAELLSLLRDVTLDFESTERGGLFSLEFAVDLESPRSLEPGPEVAAFQGLGLVRMSVILNLSFIDGRVEAELTPACALILHTRVETITIDNGHFTITHDDARCHWDVRIRDSVVRRESQVNGGREQDEASAPFYTPFKTLRLRFPDTFVDDAIASMPPRLARIGVLEGNSLNLEMTLVRGARVDLGAFSLRLYGNPRARITWGSVRSESCSVSVSLLSGFAQPVAFSKFVRATSLGATAWLRRFCNVTHGIFDWWLDSWSSILGGTVRKVDFEFHGDGSATVTYDAFVQIPFRLSAHEVREMLHHLFCSDALATLMRQYQQAVVRAGLSCRAQV